MQKREGGLGRTLGIILLVAVALFAIAWATGFINFDTSGSLRAPDVKVEGGELPAVQMETADVNVGTKETTIEVPTVDVDKPADDGSAKR
ncbi:hypothetical protein H3309_02925 [Sandaracinobacteroides saxicola]|uniref:Uncharacterized protein n=1 Tax=Sandaracinobacteroides saxicola TaxID=2759707 RepID=A0A7G5IMA5_9SPHN|nr:hypothetical protein H3309_02925 [Sandaracinobacteroides saxicola]